MSPPGGNHSNYGSQPSREPFSWPQTPFASATSISRPFASSLKVWRAFQERLSQWQRICSPYALLQVWRHGCAILLPL